MVTREESLHDTRTQHPGKDIQLKKLHTQWRTYRKKWKDKKSRGKQQTHPDQQRLSFNDSCWVIGKKEGKYICYQGAD